MSCIRFDRPAKRWKESLPVGNGKTAVMVYGGKYTERLDFNDAELWSGYPRNYDNPSAAKALSEARALCFNGDYAAAHKCVEEKADGNYTEAFMPLGTLFIRFKGLKRGKYSRSLELTRGVLNINAGSSEREAFVSFPDDVAAYSVKSPTPFDAVVWAKTPLKGRAEACTDGILSLFGVAPDKALPNYLGAVPNAVSYDEGKAMAFCLSVKTETDGTVTVSETKIYIENATYIRLYAVTATGFKGCNAMPQNDPERTRKEAEKRLRSKDFNYDVLMKRHVLDFSSLVSGEALNTGAATENARKLLRRGIRGDAGGIVGIMYDYGKYLLASGSRASQPLNLQGQWNAEVRPPWSSNLTTNINFEMNYWAASACNMSACLEPYFRACEEVAVRGAMTARTNFGAQGFCCNHNCDIWRNTSPVKGDPSYMFAPLCGAWMACEAYRHSLNAPAYRPRAVKLIEDAARFILDYLVEKDGKLTVAPSTSPETAFVYDKKRVSVGIGSAFELEVARETLGFAASAAEGALKTKAADALKRLAEVGEGERGLYEWQSGFDSAERGHRHFSPLYGVYPGMTAARGDASFEAAEKLYYDRIAHSSPGIGWSAAWSMCLAARFGDAAAAGKALKNFLSRSLLPNLFGFHPPCYFQIDANLGFVAAVNEMLLTSDKGVVSFLPALPDSLKNGKIRGLKKNGITFSFEWRDKKIIYAEADRETGATGLNIAPHAKLVNIKVIPS